MHGLLDWLFPPRRAECLVRAGTADALLAHLTPLLIEETRPECVALLPFARPEVRAALHEAKYHGSARAFMQLGTVLAEYLDDLPTDSPLDDGLRMSIIVPVPLGHTRRRERGFNQVEEVVRSTLRSFSEAGQSSFTLDTVVLERIRETPSQVSLQGRERRENMRGAFFASRPCDPRLLYIVLDDVVTTGTTLQAAIDALTAAGATRILPLALAH